MHDTVCKLEIRVSDREVEIAKKEYIALLEDHFGEDIAKLIRQEGHIYTL